VCIYKVDKQEGKMKKVFMLALATVFFACSLSFATKKSEFSFGVDRVLAIKLQNSIDYVDGKKIATEMKDGKMVPIKVENVTKTTTPDGSITETKQMVDKIVDNVLSTTGSKNYGSNGFAPKLEYCYYVLGQEDKGRMGVGLGINKFFNSDFDPLNTYLIWKITLPVNDESDFSLGTNTGYGIFNDKYETTQGTFKADKVYSAKVFVKFDYKNFFIDLSAMTNIIPIDAKIKTEKEDIKCLKENINYDVIMLGIGYKFAI
jgi:hypothetical protein